MTHHADVTSNQQHSVKSCLGDSLRRLQSNINAVRDTSGRDQDQFEDWVKKWSKRSGQIASRLEMIDSQLEKVTRHTPRLPHFNVIAPAVEDH